jgi:superfamily II DNA helicase RecQ
VVCPQEIGRAGRDGLMASCHIFYGTGDFEFTRKRIMGSYKDDQVFRDHQLRMHAALRMSVCVLWSHIAWSQ